MENMMSFLRDQFDYAVNQFKSMRWLDVLDILIVAFILYYLFKFIRNRRAGKLMIGVLLLLVFFFISNFADMHASKFLLSNLFQVGLIALIILFQPELRSALEKVGAEPFRSLKSIGGQRNVQETVEMIDHVCSAVCDLAMQKTGALIIIERTTKLGDIIRTGTVINANTDPMLIKNLFYNKAPLHDGAIVIVGTRIAAAGCFLPLSTRNDIVKDLGTRHRAAIGMSENSDAIVLVVSEETGVISVALDGNLKQNFDYGTLKNQLNTLLLTEGLQKRQPFHKKEKKDGKKKKDRQERNDSKNIDGEEAERLEKDEDK